MSSRAVAVTVALVFAFVFVAFAFPFLVPSPSPAGDQGGSEQWNSNTSGTVVYCSVLYVGGEVADRHHNISRYDQQEIATRLVNISSPH